MNYRDVYMETKIFVADIDIVLIPLENTINFNFDTKSIKLMEGVQIWKII